MQPDCSSHHRACVSPSGYFLLALLSLFFSILRRPTIAAAHKESLLAAVLLALAAAGWIHVGVTFYFLSASPAVVTMSGLFAEMAKPANWDGLFFGKIVDTFLLFTARTAWFLGIARDSPSSTSSQKQQNHKKAT